MCLHTQAPFLPSVTIRDAHHDGMQALGLGVCIHAAVVGENMPVSYTTYMLQQMKMWCPVGAVVRRYTLIVGKGIHSPNNVARIKETVTELLKGWGIPFRVEERNEGALGVMGKDIRDVCADKGVDIDGMILCNLATLCCNTLLYPGCQDSFSWALVQGHVCSSAVPLCHCLTA